MRRYTLTIAACLALAGVVELLVGGPGPHVDPAPVELDGATPEARRVDTKRPRSRSRRQPIRRSRPDRAEGERPRGSDSASGGEIASGGGGSGTTGSHAVAVAAPVRAGGGDDDDESERDEEDGGDD